MRINWRLEFVWTQRFQKDTGAAHSRDAQIILSCDAGIAATLDQSTTGGRRRFAPSSSVDSVRFGRTFSTATGSTWFGWQIEIRFWRRCIRKTRSHREEEVIREVFIQLHPVDGWRKSFFVCLHPFSVKWFVWKRLNLHFLIIEKIGNLSTKNSLIFCFVSDWILCAGLFVWRKL